MNNGEAVRVTAAVIVEEGRVLITRRRPGGRHPGCWEFPGGKVEPGETPPECLARELREELGIVATVGERLAEVPHMYHDMRIELLAYFCLITCGELRDLGCSAHAWVAPEDLGKFDLLPPDREIARLLIESDLTPEY